jgi:hypothetical protein
VVDKGEHVQIQHVDIALHLQNILFSHLVAPGIFDDGNGTVQLVQLQMMIDGEAFPGLDVVENKALLDFSYI